MTKNNQFEFPLLFFQSSIDCTLPAQMMWPVQELCHAGLELVVEIEEICPSKKNVEMPPKKLNTAIINN